ncbi:MAG: class I SAM-dependent methyltransferase [Acidobacteria bacterium]|mgnify:CR=1 FL=1|jgi:tellurite methyltransferase|nr:class I SAM-dependent methyltransferase [Acidobacteriota bacterium]
MRDLAVEFGNIDIYVFDQLHKGRISQSDKVLDAGCGSGRNAYYLLTQGVDVFCVDVNADAVAGVRALAAGCGAAADDHHFRVGPLHALTFDDNMFDVVICSTVLHFAQDDAEFEAMVRELWRVLRPGGLFFARLASSIGIESRIRPISGRRATLQDGSDRYLVDEAQLVSLTATLGGQLLDPIKTTVVQDQRAMTTWVVRLIDNLKS